jgi:hypothetical protein
MPVRSKSWRYSAAPACSHRSVWRPWASTSALDFSESELDGPDGDYTVKNAHSLEPAAIWRTAQRRRTEEIAKWLSHFLKRSTEMPDAYIAPTPLKRRLALADALVIAVVAFAAVVSA